MNIINNHFFKRVYQKLTGNYYTVSYSQTGEDVIIDFLINAKNIKDFTYLDIGANDPVKMNNTYKFYEYGCKGVCIEPDPYIFSRLKRKRNADICLNIGIADKQNSEAEFYLMDTSLLNTFSKEEAEDLERNGHARIKNVIKVPLQTVDMIIEKYFNKKSPVFVNIDVEGLDEIILLNFPFAKYRPYIFCIETVHYTNDASSEKRSVLMDIMRKNNYKPFADTYLNTIFIDAEVSF